MKEEREPRTETETLSGSEPHEYHSLMDLFEELSWREYLARIVHGLKQSRNTGEYKWARMQLQHGWGLVSAVVVPCLAVLLIAVLSAARPDPEPIPIEIRKPEPEVKLDEIPRLDREIFIPDPSLFIVDEIPEEMSREFDSPLPGPARRFSPKPAPFPSVIRIASPVILPGVMSHRLTGTPGGPAGRADNPGAERSVMSALRWLKKHQEYDGHWAEQSGGGPTAHGGAAPAMTGLALLTFLAHGEMPASREFGPTVQKAIEWLVANQDAGGHFAGRDRHDYSHPIATYALCEAFAMTKIPMIRYAAEKAVDVIVKGQNPGGLWNYNCDGSGRNDTTYSSWCAQALKAALLAGLQNQGLAQAAVRCMAGFEANQGADGGFGYTGPGSTPLTSLGVLSLQIHGGAESPSVRRGLLWLEQATCDWDRPWGSNPLYYWYYATQAKFHAGREAWNRWSHRFAPTLTGSQIVIPNGAMATDGQPVDIGYWQAASRTEHCKSYVYNTTLCALTLQVYYRYLPTYKHVEAVATKPRLEDEDDVRITVL